MFNQLECHLSEAAFSQNHDEIKIGELHAVLVAIGVVLGDVVRRRAVSVLVARTDPGSLRRNKCGNKAKSRLRDYNAMITLFN